MSWEVKKGPEIMSQRGWLVDKASLVLLTKARVIDPSQDLDTVTDILIERGKIKKIGDIDKKELENYHTLDLEGKILAPGFFDMHVHLREPGQEEKETITTGSTAAVAGGFTGVACMPNTNPSLDNVGVVRWVYDMAAGGPVDVHPIAAVTIGRKGTQLTDISDLYHAGVRAISNDGDPVGKADVMRRALEYSQLHDLVISTHSEEHDLAAGGVMREGEMSTRLGMKPWSSLAESVMVARDVLLAEFTGGRLHVGHISSWQSIEMVRWAKGRGVKVTCEATPHHIALTDEACATYDSSFKMNPPLGSKEDREAVIQGLIDGTIDAIATDHAPHTVEEKLVEFSFAPNGVVGLETAIGVVANELVNPEKMSWNEIVQKMAIAPREILRLPSASIQEGEVANLTLIDPEAVWKVDASKFFTKGRNTPFDGKNLHAKPLGVLNRGWILICPDARMLWS
ncbi:dihydroorotase [bacterium]|nr:dihydroorotase [bacterium]